MRRTTRWAWGLLTLAVVLSGCARLKDEKTVTVNAKSAAGVMEVPSQTSDMKITVTATSTAGPVALYLAATPDAEEVMLALEAGKTSPKILLSSSPGASATLEGTMSANKVCTVIAYNDGAQKTEVKASIVGK